MFALRGTLGKMPGNRILARPVSGQRLADEELQRGERRIDPLTIGAHFLVNDRTHDIAWQQFIERPCGPVGKTLLELHYRLLQAFFCYLHTWLILLVLTVTSDTTILTMRGSQPP